jgi:hypothetical protein
MKERRSTMEPAQRQRMWKKYRSCLMNTVP